MTVPLPLFDYFPELSAIPRRPLCQLPSPVDQVILDGTRLWIKRDDLNTAQLGGNKARALEFLLGEVPPGTTILTLGGEGSTHALATAIHGRNLGLKTITMRWKHEMNVTASRVSQMTNEASHATHISSLAINAMLQALFYRLTHRVHYIPAGGSTPLGVLAQVNAACELAAQVRAGVLPHPSHVVLPLGSGVTAAGLTLGFAIADFPTIVVGAKIAPTVVANRMRIMGLINRTARFIERHTGAKVPRPSSRALVIAQEAFAGAYGRPSFKSLTAADQLQRETGIRLDETYSAKAFAVALQIAQSNQNPTLFWHTFDWRILAPNQPQVTLTHPTYQRALTPS